MKLVIVFMIAGLLQVQAETNAQTVTFSGRNVAITKAFKAIEDQTGYTVFANKDLLRGIRPVSLTVKDMPLRDFMSSVLENQPVGYEIHNRTIFIISKGNTGNAAASKPEEETETALPAFVTIRGVVKGSDGQLLAGATVTIKGTRTSAITGEDGRYTIEALPEQTLVFSYVGYSTLEINIGSRTVIDATLEKSIDEIDQVVVTALGIPRRQKTLTYNVQEIRNSDISTVNNGNFVNSLIGKVAGATINSSSAGTGASTRVVLRGAKSIMNNNNALYVIDGIPMPNPVRGQASDIFSGAGQTGDFVANLNPDDIESLSVLSGPAAAALYGGNASNGVIIINTKKGNRDRTNLSVANTTSFMSPLILPKFQNTYGPSEVGSYFSWGEKLATPSSYKPADFFQTGLNTTTSLSFSTGTERSQTYVSVARTDAAGIVSNNDWDRSNFTARNTSTFLDGKMTLDLSFMAGLVNEQNMISQGQYFNPLIAVYLFPPGDDFNRVKAFERHNASRNLLTQFWPYGDNGLMMQNPYWVAKRNLFQNRKERYMTTVSLRYNIADGITISGRAKMDKNNEKSERKYAASTNTLFASENGYYSLNTIDMRQIYADAILNIDKSISEDFTINANVGGVIEDINTGQDLYGGRLLGVANLYTYGNIIPSTADFQQSGGQRQKQAVFASAQLGYRSLVYMDLTARNDWVSSLAGPNQSFFYPSVGLSSVLTDAFNIRSNKLSYLKVRASYSEVGNEPLDPFMTIPTYPLAGGFPSTVTRMPNPNLKAERTKSWEAGINAALFNGALRLDATVYSSRTYDQFFEPTLSSASGYTSVFLNAGRVDNKGIELSARYTRRVLGNLEWSTYATYSLNRNKIVEMLREWENPVTGEIISLTELDLTGTGSYKMMLREGGTMGDIFVNTLRVDEHGAIYVDPGSQSVVAEPNKFVYAGNSNPRYNLSWGNTFTWKGISLNALVAGRVGGIVVSNTQAMMDAFGVSQATADARDAGGAIVNGRPVPAREYYQVVGAGASGGIASMYVYSATNVRLAELSLGYDLPVKKFGRFVKRANVSFVGRNLFFFYNSAPFDPELTANTGTFFQGIDYFMMPSLRSMGFSVKLDF